MFSSAKKLPAAPAKAAKGKPSRPTDVIVGWEELAALDAAAKALASLVEFKKTVLENGPVKELLFERGLATGRKPESLNPVEGDGKGSAYIAKRRSNIALSEDELEALKEVVGEAEMGTYTEVVEASPALLAVNPEYASDAALLRKIDKALSGVKGIPEDFIVETEAVSKTVVSDEAVNAMFKLDADKLEAVFELLAGISMRPVYGASLEKAWEVIKPLIPEAAGLPEKPKGRKAPAPVPVPRNSAALREAFRKSAE